MTRNKQWDSLLLNIEKCKNDVDYIYQNHSDVPTIEIDIALEKLSSIYDKLLSIKLNSTINEEYGFLSKNSSIISKIIKESVFKQQQEKIETKQKNIEFVEEKKTKGSEITEEIKSSQTQIEKKENINDEIISKFNTTSNKTVAESFNQKTLTIGEMMASMYKKNDIATLQQLKPIKDLKQAISVNDKIMFIKEIFNNDADKYNTTLTEINSCQNLDEALEIIKQKVEINSENPVMQQWLELIYRRFM